MKGRLSNLKNVNVCGHCFRLVSITCVVCEVTVNGKRGFV